jgi:hypothetical protein
MKSYFIIKVLVAIKMLIISTIVFVIAKLIFQKKNFDFLEISTKDLKLNKNDL